MQLFDRLLAHDSTTKVIDLGCGQFAQFFAVMRAIDFVTEARQRLIEPVVLFVGDPQTTTVRTYGELRRHATMRLAAKLPLSTYGSSPSRCGPVRRHKRSRVKPPDSRARSFSTCQGL